MITLGSGAAIKGIADVANVVDYTIHGVDNGSTALLASGKLSDSLSVLVTANSNDIAKTFVFVNTHSADVIINLYYTPSGGSDYRLLPKDFVLSVGHSLHTDGEKVNVLAEDGGLVYGFTAHTIASHSDTTATGAELETLTDGSNADSLHIHEGTAIKSTGEAGGTKYLREDGDGTCSWQTVSASVANINDVGDVTITGTPANNEVLAYDNGSGEWINQTAAEAGLVATSDIGSTVQGYDAGLAYLDGLNFTNEATFKAGVNLEIGTDVQAQDAELSAIAGLTSAAGKLIRFTGSGTAEVIDDLESFVVACSDETTDLTTGTAKVTFRMPYAFTLTAVRASVTTAPTGSTITVDINEAGATILSTKITIDASEKTSTTAATAPVISDSSLADDSEITIDIDQIGSGTAGAGLKVYLIGRRT